jgi:hypothetical protein
MSEIDPIVGNWYRNLADQSRFEVVAVDEEGQAVQAVEIQYYEGEVEELDMDTWDELSLEFIEPPDDWSGPFDDLEPDDLGYDDDPEHRSRDDGAAEGLE